MQYSTMIKTRDVIGRGVPRALKARVSERRISRNRKRNAAAHDAARDGWLQNNAGARSQSDFWLQLLVARNMGRPPL